MDNSYEQNLVQRGFGLVFRELEFKFNTSVSEIMLECRCHEEHQWSVAISYNPIESDEFIMVDYNESGKELWYYIGIALGALQMEQKSLGNAGILEFRYINVTKNTNTEEDKELITYNVEGIV